MLLITWHDLMCMQVSIVTSLVVTAHIMMRATVPGMIHIYILSVKEIKSKYNWYIQLMSD